MKARGFDRVRFDIYLSEEEVIKEIAHGLNHDAIFEIIIEIEKEVADEGFLKRLYEHFKEEYEKEQEAYRHDIGS